MCCFIVFRADDSQSQMIQKIKLKRKVNDKNLFNQYTMESKTEHTHIHTM